MRINHLVIIHEHNLLYVIKKIVAENILQSNIRSIWKIFLYTHIANIAGVNACQSIVIYLYNVFAC